VLADLNHWIDHLLSERLEPTSCLSSRYDATHLGVRVARVLDKFEVLLGTANNDVIAFVRVVLSLHA
jgi:hypothetical protein